jgi:HK97 family phage prohead protease
LGSDTRRMPNFIKIKPPAPVTTKIIFPSLRKRAAVPAIAAPAIAAPGAALAELVGQAVFFGSQGERIAGRVKRIAGRDLVVQLAVPRRDGLLIVSDTEITIPGDASEPTQALMRDGRVKRFDAGAALQLAADEKFVTVFAPDGESQSTPKIVDYQNLVIEGYASTFGTPEQRDRGGDYVMPDAWDKTLVDFRKNPVMLTDHDNDVCSLVGSWTKIGVDARGLAVRGSITNAPGAIDTRFKLAEGHLKGLSIGGIWYYIHDGFGIEEADLFEISLVAVPMNPDTLAQTRSLGEADCRKAFARFWHTHSTLRAE